ncbi:adenine deaminase [Acetobacterium tundrae]|uniref:Adenine deaminase n=1 Tax=Acetobacterium tundrae TaxID=132932 RepID=A0ABR6WNY7_9FIRM|nr:adenine deaminase C-terminal domain-containing protein [Acetobacterium tundrae]MBC3797875.1 amidohydrolase family protein [Acetobacterium tundrae]
MNKKLIAVAGGNAFADIVVKNGKIVNVYSGEIYDGGVAISGDTIAAVGDVDYTIGENTKIIDAKGHFITPGFIDGHIHPESTSLSIRPFAEIVLKHGTTAIFTDLHEVGVVAGLEAIEAVLEEAQATDLKLYFVVPSHVPFSPNLETSGGSFNTEIIKKALEREDAVGLSECVGQYILAGFPDLLDSMDATLEKGKSLQGHLPDISGPALNVCAAIGVSTDHESLTGEDVVARLRAGLHVMIREGSAARGLKDGLKPILENNLDSSRVSIVTDDLHTIDAVKRGHLDDAVRIALEAGTDFAKAIQFVSLNAARAFGLDHQIGGLAPGKRADVNITTGPEDFKVLSVIAGGKPVVENEKLLVSYPKAEHVPILLNTIKLSKKIEPEDFKICVSKTAKKARVKVMDTLPWIPITIERIVELNVENGVVQSDVKQDVLYIAQVERYGKNGNIGKAFMGGFSLKSGAIASSVGHDNHNIIVLGTNHEDMAVAVNRVAEIQGGQVVVDNGQVVKEVAYPILGLLSDLSAEELAAEKEELNQAIHELGSPITIPFMFLSFICLAALPSFAITDHGFIDVATQTIIDPILAVIE